MVNNCNTVTGTGVGKMTVFYDAKNEYQLAEVEEVLEAGGIEYSVKVDKSGNEFKEVMVAEEDVPRAEELLYLSSRRIFCSLAQGCN